MTYSDDFFDDPMAPINVVLWTLPAVSLHLYAADQHRPMPDIPTSKVPTLGISFTCARSRTLPLTPMSALLRTHTTHAATTRPTTDEHSICYAALARGLGGRPTRRPFTPNRTNRNPRGRSIRSSRSRDLYLIHHIPPGLLRLACTQMYFSCTLPC